MGEMNEDAIPANAFYRYGAEHLDTFARFPQTILIKHVTAVDMGPRLVKEVLHVSSPNRSICVEI